MIFYKKTLEKSVGFVASKKVGNAIKRAKARRRLKGLFLKWQDELTDGTYIFVAKPKIIFMKNEELNQSLKWSFKKISSF